jgi:superfamily II DNA or RNA helicase/DNA invertase Pin-like site-specific DNA recombinase
MPSKHANAGLLIQRGLYDNLHSFAELEQRISALGDENTKIVGDAFEILVEGYLATHQKMQAEAVWLVGQVPLDVRQKLNLPNDAKGIDGVLRTRTGTLVPYQVKFRSQRAYLTYTEVAPFLGLTERATDRIVFTNSNELAADVKNRDGLRTVRGIDFDELTKDDLEIIVAWLKKQPVTLAPPVPHGFQVEALSEIAKTFAFDNRAQVIMACGTGKTLVALWAVEQLKARTILVLVPSLTLLQQTLNEWSRHNSWGASFSYLCVCSDPSVTARDENDPIQLDKTDLEFHVDTDPTEVRRFLERNNPSTKVVFSTYQSSRVVAQGARGLPPFDIAIFDEAHKTTGFKGRSFAHCLFEENVRIRKRLFLTATPRHYDIRHRSREGDFQIYSMDNTSVYGPRAYTLSFGSAARRGIICNYKVLVSVVDGQEVNNFALKYGITLVQGDLVAARWVANQIAVERAIVKTGAERVITFHSRVSSAKEFASDSARGIKQYLAEFSVYHVNGAQRSSERKQLIRSFRDADKALITNARCLTEGIDVPAVDMVAFVDPRHSKIDIAQATGRAMRKVRGSDKAVGYVVVPLFLDRSKDETLEDALMRTEFDEVADVLNSMQEQDEELADIVCELKQAKGRDAKFDPRPLAERINVLGPAVDLSTLRANIFAEIVDRLGSFWDEMYGRLIGFFKEHGHSNVHQHYERDKQLGNWVKKLRSRKERLSAHRIASLNKLNFVWDPFDATWNESYQELAKFYRDNGHTNLPQNHTNQRLLRWAHVQRQEIYLTPERKARLDELGFVWSRTESKWDELFAQLMAYKEKHGDVNILHSADKDLRRWVAAQRRKKRQGLLGVDRIEKLEQIGFIWNTKELLKKRAWGRTQEIFESLVLRVLRDVGRPMRSGELIREFRKRGHPIPGNAVRAAWNRLWTARNKGLLINDFTLGYWIAGEPLSEDAKQRAAQIAWVRPTKGQGPSPRVLAKGRKKGPPPAMSADDVERAEEMLLSGKPLLEVATIFGISVTTLRKYTLGGIHAVKTRYPNVIIPKRPHVPRPRRPGIKGVGRPPKLTPDQAQQIAVMRAAGTTINEIASATGAKRSTIYRYLKNAKPTAGDIPEPIGEDMASRPE